MRAPADDSSPDLTSVSEAAALRALAHPLRQRLYEQLVLFGPLTATELAARVDDSPSNCSWHLRKLAEHGFVEEADQTGSGRRRPWQAAVRGLRWGDEKDADPDTAAAAQHLARMVLEREVARLQEAWLRLATDDQRWQDAATMTQSMLWLSAQELQEANGAIREILLRTRDRHEHPERRPAGSRLCAFLAWGTPTYGLAEPTEVRD
jgi:DNA-binding transcriptional ArsR family regulator